MHTRNRTALQHLAVILVPFVVGCAPKPRSSASTTPQESATGENESPLSKQTIRAVISSHLGDARKCYAAELAKDRWLEGPVWMEIEIDPAGEVESAVMLEFASGLALESLNQCLCRVVRTWKFPTSVDGASIAYAFEFATTE